MKKEALDFKCKRCGNCCGMPLFKPEDKDDFANAKQISESLKMDFTEIGLVQHMQAVSVNSQGTFSNFREYDQNVDLGITPMESFNQYKLVIEKKLKKAVCPFLHKEGDIAQCTVYALRPKMCRVYQCTDHISESAFRRFKDAYSL